MLFTAALALARVGLSCPECKTAAADMADQPQPVDPKNLTLDQPDGETLKRPPSDRRFHVNAGVDFPSSYFFRGYAQQTEGFIVQPFITLSATIYDDKNIRVRPYIGWWNSFGDTATTGTRGGHGPLHSRTVTRQVMDTHSHDGGQTFETHPITVTETILGSGASGDGKGWYESDIMAGVTTNIGELIIDIQYHLMMFPDDSHDQVQEVGAKISYDLASIWQPDKSQRDFSLKPHFTVYQELEDRNGSEETYMEVGIEPAYRFKLFGQRAGVSAPVYFGFSPNGYYVDNDGDDTTAGYLGAAIKGTIVLPIDEKLGTWYLNGSVTYLDLIADSVRDANGGDGSQWIGSVGIGVSF
jgi:hypothetical protein